MGWKGVEIYMNRAEVETFKIQHDTSCFRDAIGCTNCMNETPCHWYLSFSAFLDTLDTILQSFLGSGLSENKRFLIIKEGVVTKL